LSIPGVTALRHRPATVTAAGVNLQQEPVIVTGTEEFARALEHETDHLHGELFIDALDSGERKRVLRQIHADQISGHLPSANYGSGRR